MEQPHHSMGGILNRLIATFLLAACLFLGSKSVQLHAQPTPVDLTELGLEQILSMPIIRGDRTDGVEVKKTFGNRFRFGYEYIQARFEDYQDGTTKLSVADVFAAGFAVVPAEITQEAHLFKIGYELSDRVVLNLLIPMIRQSTFHFGPKGGMFEEFTIDTQGLGDIGLSASYIAWTRANHALVLDAGFSLPTGSIDEFGRTPRSATFDTIVPYTMQLGSGTVDFKPAITYVGSSDWLEWGTGAQANLRLGKNSRDYSLSNRVALRNWVTLTTFKSFQPSLRLATEVWDRIHGADNDLFIIRPDGSRFTPAPVTDPALFGGEKVSVGLSLRFPFRDGFLAGQSIEIEGGIPVYQRLNGPQPGETWRMGIAWNLHL
jgi:hypothetical protein